MMRCVKCNRPSLRKRLCTRCVTAAVLTVKRQRCARPEDDSALIPLGALNKACTVGSTLTTNPILAAHLLEAAQIFANAEALLDEKKDGDSRQR